MLQGLWSQYQRERFLRCFERELAALEAQIEGEGLDHQAALLALAAERCVEAGEEARALSYFGRTIDANLEFGCFDIGLSTCERMIELYPRVVRTRCTIAFLALSRDLPHLPFADLIEDARRRLGDYVVASERARLAALATARLRLMASVTDRHELRELIAECLFELGDSVGADRVFVSSNAERSHPQPPAAEDQRERWARALRVPVLSLASPGLHPPAPAA